jgi:hypothetical protein
MTDLLQSSDASSGVEDTADQLLLVRLMVASIKKAVGKSICPKTKQDPDVTQRKVLTADVDMSDMHDRM